MNVVKMIITAILTVVLLIGYVAIGQGSIIV